MKSLVLLVTVAACHASDSPLVDARDAPTSSLPAGDEFDGATLGPTWDILDATRADIAVANGSLTIAPHGNALWFNAGTGPLVYKLATGDFKVTSTVHARKTSDATQPPDRPIEVGGLMLRNPAAPPENYVFLDIGFAEQQRLGVEHKSTRDSASTFDETPSSADADLRLCRTGSTISAWRRDPASSSWQLELTVDRPDLPATVQVGLDASTGQATPDVTIHFDNVSFDLVGGGCDR
jgi:hypothetical protein